MRLLPLTFSLVLLAATAGCLVKSSPPPPPAAPVVEGIPATATNPATAEKPVDVKRTSFGKLPSGEEIFLYTCTNHKGAELKLITYGAHVTSVSVPDRQGKAANVTLGFDSLAEYLGHSAHFGSTVGRFGNRIAKGKFTLDGQEYTLATNNGANHLHGGVRGFDKVIWNAEEVHQDGAGGVKFTYHSPDGDEGYPGNLDATVTYLLTPASELRIEYLAKTDKPTVVNLTNHCYWNLAGAGQGDILDHELTLAAKHVLPVDQGSIPTGEMAEVADTPFDFLEAHAIGSHIDQLPADGDDPGGYDHCYVLDSQDGSLALAARVKHPASGRVMEIRTTQPGIQFYTGNYLNGAEKNGGHQKHAAFCLETQHYPDSPNRPEFPTTVLRPGETYKQVTVHKFWAE